MRKRKLLKCLLMPLILIIISIIIFSEFKDVTIIDKIFKHRVLVDFYLRYPNFVNWLLVISSFSVALIALFRKEIYSVFKKPKLIINIPERIQETVDEVDAMNNGQFVEKQAYLLIEIENIGTANANDVEVFLTGLDSNTVNNFQRYKSLHLLESWTKKPSVRMMHPNINRSFTLCFLRRRRKRPLCFSSDPTPNALIDIECREDSEFEFFIIAIADNAKPIKRKVKIQYDGNYIDGFSVTTTD